MKIPLGVDQEDFVKTALKNNVTIQSRYEGVYFKKGKRIFRWIACYGRTKDHNFQKTIGRYSLTEEGEKEASLAYINYCKENNLKVAKKTYRKKYYEKNKSVR